jgi:hypothetical protein
MTKRSPNFVHAADLQVLSEHCATILKEDGLVLEENDVRPILASEILSHCQMPNQQQKSRSKSGLNLLSCYGV